MKKNTKKWEIGRWKKEDIKQRMDRRNYPAAPSAGRGVLRLYEKYFLKALGRKRKAKIMILGATPESRDMVLKHGHELVTVDWNMETVEIWGSVMKFKNHPRETIVRCDWLNIPLKSNYFDLIMGDGVSNNISLENQDKFFKEIKRLLKPNGFIVLRDTIIDSKREIRKSEEIDSSLSKKKIHWFDAFFDFMCYSDIVPSFRNEKAYVTDMSKLASELEKGYRKKRISKRSLEVLFNWFKNAGVRTILSRSKFETYFKRYFKLVSIKQAKDYKFTQDTMIFFFGQVKK